MAKAEGVALHYTMVGDCLKEINELRMVLRRIITHGKVATAMNTNHAQLATDIMEMAQQGLRRDETD